MGNLKSLKNEFDIAQRTLLQILFNSDETQNNPTCVQIAPDHMSQAFNALLIGDALFFSQKFGVGNYVEV